MAMTQRVFKGSGEIFVREHSDSKPFPAPADIENITQEEFAAIAAYLVEIKKAENELGYIKNGYTFTETMTAVSDAPDLGQMRVDDISEETASNAFALFNANGETIKKMHPLARTGTEGTSGFRLTSVGGIKNKNDASYDMLFVHSDTVNGDICIFTVGKNVEGLTLQFQPTTVTPLPVTYAAQAIDNTGTLAHVIELPVGFDWATGQVKGASTQTTSNLAD